ncbi:MAG: hypothetical protein OXD42_09315 [Rhodospirillaceae bacterium]|nr:hypothetical protein [Rhodospirillaceae bacterium]
MQVGAVENIHAHDPCCSPTLYLGGVCDNRIGTVYGADVDPQMARLATMNLTLRGLDRVRILRRGVLTRPLDRVAKGELGFPARGFDVILASPLFSGRLDRNSDLCTLRTKGKNVRQIN